ncbi:MAG: amidohydrolase family protein [Frankiales bacterium]|nr:amidohydrolase family protein [Frankiales bacterium]
MTRTLFSGGSVFDPASGAVQTADVVIEDGLVVDVGPGLDGDTAVDATGRTILPGLMDCHVHMTMSDFNVPRMMDLPFSMPFFEMVGNMRTVLDLGITTVRDAWGSDQGVQHAQRAGLLAGPRLLITIRMISQTGGHADPYERCGGNNPIFPPYPGSPDGTVDGVEEVRLRVRELIRAGADGIKVAASGGVLSPNTDSNLPQLRLDELTELVVEAEHAGRWVMAHCHSAAGARNAVEAGVRSIEHGSFLDAEALEMMAERGTWLVPTLIAAHGVAAAAERGETMPERVLEKARQASESAKHTVRRAKEAGVPIAMGTDCPVSPHGTNLEELKLMVEAGLTPAEALVAATSSAAKLLRLDQELGSLEAGKRADLVLVSGDPFDFEGYADRVEQVWQDGVRVSPS